MRANKKGRVRALKKQISFVDSDARMMGKKGDFDYRYNGQISVDSDQQVIIGQHLSQNANDKQEVKTALESIEKNTEMMLPEKMSLDKGFKSGKNLLVLEQSGGRVVRGNFPLSLSQNRT